MKQQKQTQNKNTKRTQTHNVEFDICIYLHTLFDLNTVVQKTTIYKKNLAFFKKNNIFYWLKNECRVSEKELIKTFNCGLGMILVVPKKEKEKIMSHFNRNKQPVLEVGKITSDKSITFI